jgi:hypothetical protein
VQAAPQGARLDGTTLAGLSFLDFFVEAEEVGVFEASTVIADDAGR